MTGTDTATAWKATDWLARTAAPAWLRAAGFTNHALALEDLGTLTVDTTDTAWAVLDSTLAELRAHRREVGARVATPALAQAYRALHESGVYTARWDAWHPGDWSQVRDAAWHCCYEAAWVVAWLASENVPAFVTADNGSYYWEARHDAARAALAGTVLELQPT